MIKKGEELGSPQVKFRVPTSAEWYAVGNGATD